MRKLSAALVLCAAVAGQTGTAQAAPVDRANGANAAGTAANSIREVTCNRPAVPYLEFWNSRDGKDRCFAYAGTMSVGIYDVTYFYTGDNDVRLTFKTIQGRVYEEQHPRFTQHYPGGKIAVIKIQIL